MPDPLFPHNALSDLPPTINLEESEILKTTIRARSLIGELKGTLRTLDNPMLLLNSLILRESQASSEIENIVTTQDELFRAFSQTQLGSPASAESKEILRYREAMWAGLEAMRFAGGLSTNVLVKIVQVLRAVDVTVRKTPGTKLANPQTREILYTPPDGFDLISDKLSALESFIHAEDEIDPLIKAALMHYQFEAIHPFTDGNGRTGRIAIVLYLVHQQLLSQPVLFISGYFLKARSEYYRLLNGVTFGGHWQAWICYFLDAVAETASETLNMVADIEALRTNVYAEIVDELGGLYAAELTSLLHQYPYIKIGTLVDRQIAKRETASKYLSRLVHAGILTDQKSGRDRYFINHRLMDILSK